jgi:hypothetical protein
LRRLICASSRQAHCTASSDGGGQQWTQSRPVSAIKLDGR